MDDIDLAAFVAEMNSTSSVFSPVPESARRARTGVLRRSCEACRSLKARCIPAPESARRCCKRCISNGLDCVFEEAIARPKRPRPAARTRVKDVEDKLDSLIALIAARNESQAKSTAPVVTEFATPQSSTASACPGDDSHPIFPDNIDFNTPVTPPMLDVALSSPQDVLAKGIVSVQTAECFLLSFAAEAASMPFVVLSPHMNLEFMRRERPCLLLAIMVSYSEHPLQEKLVQEFMRLVAQRVIVDAKKSIDFVQALIVFCLWHHRCSNPNHFQLYQLSQIAVSIAVDLGLPQISQMSAVAKNSRSMSSNYSDELERTRTYLGCYYLSHSISIAVWKPTHLKHSRRIEEAAKLIASVEQMPSDKLIPHYIRLQRFTEDVERAFEYNDPDIDEMDGVKIHAMVKTLERQLAQLYESTPPEVRENPSIKLEYKFLRIYITQVGLETPSSHDALDLACCSWCASSTRMDLILSCVRAAHAYLDAYLALPGPAARALNVVEVGRHMLAVMVLARVTIRDANECGSVTAKLDAAALAEVADIRGCLEASQRGLAGWVTMLEGGRPKQDTFWQMHKLVTLALASFSKDLGQIDIKAFDAQIVDLKMDQVMLSPAPREYCATMECLALNSSTEKSMGDAPGDPAWAAVDAEMMWPGDLAGLSPAPNWFDM